MLWQVCLLCLLQVQDHSHGRGSLWGCLGLCSSMVPGNRQLWKAEAHSPPCPCRESQRLGATTFSGSGKTGKKKKQLSFPPQDKWAYLSHYLRQPQCQAGVIAPLCPAPFSHFAVPLGLLVLPLGPRRPRQSLFLGNIAKQHSLKKGQLKWSFAFSLFVWQLKCRGGELDHKRCPRSATQRCF